MWKTICTSTAPFSLRSNSSQVEMRAAIAMTFSIVRAIPSAPRPAKEKHVPFLSIKQPDDGRHRQTMPGRYRLPGCCATQPLHSNSGQRVRMFTRVCVRLRIFLPFRSSPRYTHIHRHYTETYTCAIRDRRVKNTVQRDEKERKVVELPFQN